MKLESKHNIAKYIMAFGGIQGVIIAIGLIRNKLVAWILGPNGMGIIALYNSAMQMMQNLTNLGLDKSGVPILSQAYESGDKALLHDTIKQLRSLFMLAALLALSCGVVFSWLLSLVVFRNFGHTLHFLVLSPAVSMLIVSGGELLIMKAVRRLKAVVALSVWNVVITFIVTVPLYFFWGARAIIPSLVLTAFTQMLVVIVYSYKKYPLQLCLKLETIKTGMPIIKLGAAFVVASSMTSGADFLVRSFIYNIGSETAVGLFNIACMMALTYGGMVFASVDSEYYPRLCQIQEGNSTMLSATVIRQIKVSLMFIVPMIVAMELFMPVIIPLLFSNQFVEAIPMTQITLLSLLFRAVYLPIGYVPLSKGDSKTFVFIEGSSAIVLFAAATIGFYYGGLIGASIGFVVSHAIDVILNIIVNYRRYGLFQKNR